MPAWSESTVVAQPIQSKQEAAPSLLVVARQRQHGTLSLFQAAMPLVKVRPQAAGGELNSE